MIQRSELVRGLGVWGSASVVVGTIIGSGIFLVASSMTQRMGTPAWVFLVWICGGALSLAGALTYAELGAMMPEAGGEYVYLREAYSPLWGFLYGWSQFLVMKTASVATLAAGFARYFGYFFPSADPKVTAIGIIAILAFINYFGVRTGGAVQTFFTVLKVGLILGIVFAALAAGGGAWANMHTSIPVSSPLGGFAAALVAALWAYDGWNNLSMAGGEVANPQKNIPRSLILGTAAVALLYLLANVAYFYVLPAPAIAASKVVAADAARSALGAWGGRAVAVAAMVSIFAALNGSILAGARVPFAMARDGVFFRALAHVNPRFHSPDVAVLLLCVASALMALTGQYEELFTYVIFASWIYYGLTAASVFVLRHKHPDWPRPYRTLGYPVLPALFVIVSGWLVVMTLREQAWWRSLLGLGIIAAGVPLFLFFRGRARHAAGAAAVLLVLLCPGAVQAASRNHENPRKVLMFALNDGAALDSLRSNGRSATSVSPQWYAIAAEGRLTGAASPEVLTACRQSDVMLTPAIINQDFSPQAAAAFLSSSRARAAAIRDLAARARELGYRGYVLDFENLPASSRTRQQYSTFVSDMHKAFRKHSLSLAVALPAPSPRQQQSFDFAAIARAADQVVLMAYDQHSRFGVPGPIAGYDWVEASLDATLRLVPAGKLLLGIALYHRNWGEASATAGSYNDAVALRLKSGAELKWDEQSRAHWFGFMSDGRLHTVWVEDARSVAEKLALAQRKNLAGIAGWRLGQEDPAVWNLLRQFRAGQKNQLASDDHKRNGPQMNADRRR